MQLGFLENSPTITDGRSLKSTVQLISDALKREPTRCPTVMDILTRLESGLKQMRLIQLEIRGCYAISIYERQ